MSPEDFMQRTQTELEHTKVWVRALEYVVKDALSADAGFRTRVARRAASDESLSESVRHAVADMVAGVPEN